MTNEFGAIEYGKHLIDFSVIRRERRTLEIAVEPDTSVIIAAPLDATKADIEAKVKKRAGWIRKQQAFFAQFLPRTPVRKYESGETHLYLGRQYRLKVRLAEHASVKLVRGFILVASPSPNQTEMTRSLVEEWYRKRAKIKFAERLKICLERFPEKAAFQPKEIIVRKLKQRWGSMSPSRRLLLNRRLVEAPTDAIDYVITHELCHIAHPNHGAAFLELFGSVMSDWPKRKRRLERVMA